MKKWTEVFNFGGLYLFGFEVFGFCVFLFAWGFYFIFLSIDSVFSSELFCEL